jgi:predicted ATPase/class 3 adenylate cyclase/Tfp pilus assembly protein PilF
MADVAPTGTVTLMFTDIQDSTTLWERLGDAFRPILDAHNRLIREMIERWDGYEVKSQGDSFMVAFERGTDALQCAIEIQRDFAAQEWPAEVGELLVRIGLHTGEPFLGYDAAGRPDYFGPVVNRAARIEAAGHGGQILLSSATRDVVQGAVTPDVDLHNLGFHRLRGLEYPEHLFEARHPDLPRREFPPLRTLDTARTNLPVQSSPFIGREKELAELQSLLSKPENRLLTLVGLGGIGKTRLALELAELSSRQFDDGVWWVELAEARSAEAMIHLLADELHLPIKPQPSPAEQMREYLRDRAMLLVLDSTEQIADAAAVVNELLHAALRVRYLVTSRQPLGLQAERVLEVAALPLDECEVLFIERARARQADFALAAGSSVDVAELCRRLEGVPLAIELAASRITAMTPRAILAHLHERFRVLQTRAPDLPPRLRSLRAAIGWSYDLLSEEEKSVFGQLSVFRGGFFLDAAEAVVGPAALDVVAELRDKSLLSTREVSGQMRYLMLESINEYAAERLEDSDRARAAHAEHFLRLAAEQASGLNTRDEERALLFASLEMGNLRAAWQWAAAGGRDELMARLALASGELLRRQGWWQERLLWLRDGLAAAERTGELDPNDLARLRYQLGYAYMDHGQFGPARQLLEASLDTCRETGDPAGEADCLNRLGNLTHFQGRFDEARLHYEDALLLRRLAGDLAGEASLLNNLGVLAQYQGNLEEARQHFEESLEIDRQLNNLPGIMLMLNNLGRIALERGDLAGAQDLLDQSRELNAGFGDRWLLAHTLHNLGDVARSRSEVGSARDLYRQALTIRRELGDAQHEIAESLLGIGRLLVEEQRWTDAALMLTVAEASLVEANSPDLGLARAALQQVESEIGAAQLAQAQRLANRLTIARAAERALEL